MTLAFGLGFPIVILALLTAIQSNAPETVFEISNLSPGICVFGLSFMSLFAATLIAKDRESALLQRLYTTPMTAIDFLIGYMVPIIPISLMQCVVTLIAAVILGLDITVGIVWILILIIPSSLLYIALGMICGSTLNSKAVGGICGALLTNLSAWLSGTWFDLDLVGGLFKDIANILPFYHAVELTQAGYACDLASAMPHLAVVMAWGLGLTVIAILCFIRQMKKQ